MKIAIRVDASIDMGSGHVMRCLTLACYLQQQGHQIIFICREHVGHLIDFICQKGFEVQRLKCFQTNYPLSKMNTHGNWLGMSEVQDFIECRPSLTVFKPDWLIVDHYAIGRVWQQQVRQYIPNVKIMVIDDLADREHDCDILLDQNIEIEGKNDYKHLVPTHCRLLIGSKYCLLRKEFSECIKNERKSNQVFAYFGSADPKNYSQNFIHAFHQQNLDSIYNLKFVTSRQNPNLIKIIHLSKQYDFECIVDDNNIAKHMSESKFAIIACGFTCYELASLGVPAIYFASSDIQRRVAKGLTKMGVGVFAENGIDSDFKVLISQLEAIQSKNFLDFDALGVKRVAESMER